jgi:hypothetical protein
LEKKIFFFAEQEKEKKTSWKLFFGLRTKKEKMDAIPPVGVNTVSSISSSTFSSPVQVSSIPLAPPMQAAFKEDPLDVFRVLSKEQLAKTWLVVMPKNEFSSHQKCRLYVVTPENQNPNPSEQAKAKMNNLSLLARPDVKYPKLTVILPPMQLRSKAMKMAGPGCKPTTNNAAEASNMTNWVHKFWLTASVEGLPEHKVKLWGGPEELHRKQLMAIQLLKNAAEDLERKRFFHPELKMEESQEEVILARYKRFNSGVTLQQALEAEFESYVSDHNSCKIISNLLPGPMGTQQIPGISLTSKAWYQPQISVPDEENKKAVEAYKECARINNFTPNPDIIAGLSRGLRHRRIDCYGLRNKQFEWMKPPVDPMKFHARGGDFVQAKISYNIYETGSRGGTWLMERIKIIHQATNQQNQAIEADPGMEGWDDVKDRYEPTPIPSTAMVPACVSSTVSSFPTSTTSPTITNSCTGIQEITHGKRSREDWNQDFSDPSDVNVKRFQSGPLDDFGKE